MLLALLPAQAVAQAVTCDELRTNIQAKIKGNGVKEFTVEVLDAKDKPQAQVVGTCDRGSKVIVYRKASGTAFAAPVQSAKPAAAASVPSKRGGIVTECADGRVITSGSCKAP